MKQYLECGKIVSTHGIRGEVKVQPWCDSPEYLCQFPVLYLDEGKTPIKVHSARTHKDMVLLLLEGYGSIDEAAVLRGKTLYLDRADDPDPDAVFLQDLIGMEVLDADAGTLYGNLTQVIQTGANDVFVLRDANGKERLVPDIPDVVVGTDFEKGRMLIRPLRGLFDDAD